MPTEESRDSMQAGIGDGLIPYETRYKSLVNADPDQALPYALAAVNTLGKGSVVAVGARGSALCGLQFTLPINMMHNILSVIAEYDVAGLPAFPTPIIYTDRVSHVTRTPGDLKPFVDTIGLIPPDMSVIYSLNYVAVSGPASREAYYAAHIKPQLDKLVSTAP